MKNKILSLFFVLILLASTSLETQAQLAQKEARPIKAYAIEYLGANIGLGVGGALTTGLFLVGFISAFGGSDAATPLFLGAAGAALATPVLSGLLIHAFGKKYNPNGKLGYAILGSYLGLTAASGIAALGNLVFQDYNEKALLGFMSSGTSLLAALIPGAVGVFFYNKFPRNLKSEISLSLFQKSPDGWNSGIPSLSVIPHPAIPGKYCTQISLLNVVF